MSKQVSRNVGHYGKEGFRMMPIHGVAGVRPTGIRKIAG